jgi:hypothetical protein
MNSEAVTNSGAPVLKPAKPEPTPIFGVNEMRLSLWQLVVSAVIVLVFMTLAPRIWTHLERFDTGPDYRIPYPLSSDYWLYQRRANSIPLANTIPVIGDSVVWGEYVLKDGTLTHFLSQESGQPGRFANCGVNGVFPLALEGLIGQYGGAFENCKVIVQCNLLWQSSPKADLSIDTEETFNHEELVPQRFGAVPCYRANAADRMGAFMNTHIGFFGWVNHINSVYFNQESIPKWTLQEDDSNPPRLPNAWKNPLSQIDFKVPPEPIVDPQRGPASKRHRPWTSGGTTPSHFEWVDLNHSLQWHAMQKLVNMLRNRGDDVLVILGPFNEHMIASDQLGEYRSIRDGAAAWFASQRIPCVVPAMLPSNLYADASHPLTAGYALLAKEIWSDPVFEGWVKGSGPIEALPH